MQKRSDKARALTKIPRDYVRGSTLLETNAKMNRALKESAGLSTMACADLSVEDLHATLAVLHSSRDPSLEAVYASDDDNRRLSAGDVRSDDLELLRAQWAAEAGDDAELAKYARCHDAAKWYVHHTTQDVKDELAQNDFVLPLLPTDEPVLDGVGDVAKAGYGAAISCQACHAQDAVSNGNSESRAFPESLSYGATAYGSFPFWDNSGPGCNSCDRRPRPTTVSRT